jgi:hypothetical protein
LNGGNFRGENANDKDKEKSKKREVEKIRCTW